MVERNEREAALQVQLSALQAKEAALQEQVSQLFTFISFSVRFFAPQSHIQRQVITLTTMLARRADLEGSGRSAAKPPADSSEDSESEGDSGDDDAVAIRVKQQQQQQQQQQQDYHHQQHEENLRIERELHNLRQEQASATESLLQQVCGSVTHAVAADSRSVRLCFSRLAAAEARDRVVECAAGPKAGHHPRLGEVGPNQPHELPFSCCVSPGLCAVLTWPAARWP